MRRVLFDGWPLVHEPLSAAAWHLRTLLALNPEGVQPLVALPTEAGTSPGFEAIHLHSHDRAAWEQRLLPRLAEEHRADAIHTTSPAASLLGKTPTFVSPADSDAGSRSRLGKALAQGGLARAAILWPEDAPKTKLPGKLRSLPAVVHPDFKAGSAERPSHLDLPDEFLLVQGKLNEEEILRLLESWTWAAASIGELYPLVITDQNASMKEFLAARLPEFHVQDSVMVLDHVQAQDMPGIFRASSAVVFLGEPEAWGNALRHALACGKAVVARQGSNTEAMVGPAAYLVPAEDLRAFGAAMITVVVDENAREKLEEGARGRAAHWSAGKFKDALLESYREIS